MLDVSFTHILALGQIPQCLSELFLAEGEAGVQCWITALTVCSCRLYPTVSVSGREAKFSRSGLLIIHGEFGVVEPLL